MQLVNDRKLSALVSNAHRRAEHPGYLALQPIIDLLEAALFWLTRSRKRQRDSRPSLPPRA
jgi:hypothetical protein